MGSNSFSHVVFSDPGCAEEVAEAEISKCGELARALDLKMGAFVYLRNEPGHLEVLRRHGFSVTRGR